MTTGVSAGLATTSGLGTANFGQQSAVYLHDIQQRIYSDQTALSTNMAAQTYSGISQDAERAVDYENIVSKLNQYDNNNAVTNTKLSLEQTTISSMQTTVTNFQSELVSFNSSVDLGNTPLSSASQAKVTQIQQDAFSALKSIEGLMNTTGVDGQYLFSGGRVGTAPAQFTDVAGNEFTTLAQFQAVYNAAPPAPAVATPFPTTAANDLNPAWSAYHKPYYAGDQMQVTNRVNETQTIQTGVFGNDPAFEKAFRGIAMIAQGGTPTKALMGQATTIISDSLNHSPANLAEASSDFTSVLQTIDNAQVTIKDVKANNANAELFYGNLISGIEDTNTVQVAAQMNQDLTALQVSYVTLGKIQGLSLANYIS